MISSVVTICIDMITLGAPVAVSVLVVIAVGSIA